MNRQLAALLVLALLSRLLLLAETPFEVDAVLLSRGVSAFDPSSMRPHPPGYAGVILLGKLLPFEPALSLRLVAAFAVVILAATLGVVVFLVIVVFVVSAGADVPISE